eukprot:25709-Eustigmatos_ZCMA.PRE.1
MRDSQSSADVGRAPLTSQYFPEMIMTSMRPPAMMAASFPGAQQSVPRLSRKCTRSRYNRHIVFTHLFGKGVEWGVQERYAVRVEGLCMSV